jgi:hypothetical protein
MHDSETEADLRALRGIRRHLTIAYLAVEQLCRKFGSFPPTQRLCSFVTDALTGIRDEVVGLEQRVLRRMRRDDSLPDEFPSHPPDL